MFNYTIQAMKKEKEMLEEYAEKEKCLKEVKNSE